MNDFLQLKGAQCPRVYKILSEVTDEHNIFIISYVPTTSLSLCTTYENVDWPITFEIPNSPVCALDFIMWT